MLNVVQTISIRGFDCHGEPSVKVMNDGSLEITFEFMPPSDVEPTGKDGLGDFANFDVEMANAAGVPVLWVDRESFRINVSTPEILIRVKKFIENYRKLTP